MVYVTTRISTQWSLLNVIKSSQSWFSIKIHNSEAKLLRYYISPPGPPASGVGASCVEYWNHLDRRKGINSCLPTGGSLEMPKRCTVNARLLTNRPGKAIKGGCNDRGGGGFNRGWDRSIRRHKNLTRTGCVGHGSLKNRRGTNLPSSHSCHIGSFKKKALAHTDQTMVSAEAGVSLS
jgi:hypothetical protein